MSGLLRLLRGEIVSLNFAPGVRLNGLQARDRLDAAVRRR